MQIVHCLVLLIGCGCDCFVVPLHLLGRYDFTYLFVVVAHAFGCLCVVLFVCSIACLFGWLFVCVLVCLMIGCFVGSCVCVFFFHLFACPDPRSIVCMFV